MRDIALFLIFLLTALAGFPLMKRLDRFLLNRVKGPEEADQPLRGERRRAQRKGDRPQDREGGRSREQAGGSGGGGR